MGVASEVHIGVSMRDQQTVRIRHGITTGEKPFRWLRSTLGRKNGNPNRLRIIICGKINHLSIGTMRGTALRLLCRAQVQIWGKDIIVSLN
jgi:hypothetical protein